MRWNFRPTDPVFMDLETQSAVSLRAEGAKVYLRSSTTRLLSAVFRRGQKTVVWVPTGRAPNDLDFPNLVVSSVVPDEVNDWVTEGATFVAHNAASFDAPAWSRFIKDHNGLEPTWCDTVPFCRAGGLPAGLDKACRALGIPGKDVEGAKALKLLYTAKMRGTKVVYPVGTNVLWHKMLAYNVQDVMALEHLFLLTSDYVNDDEVETLEMDAEINERGFPVDVRLAANLRQAWQEHQNRAAEAVDELTEGEISGTDIRSVAKVKAWLKRQGFDATTLERKAVEALMRDPDGFFGDHDDPIVSRVTAVIRERQQAVRATAGKVDRAIKTVDPDHRIRWSTVYHGAHTGRWSGRDFQPHNMPRGAKVDVEWLLSERVTLERVDQEAKKTGVGVGDVLGTLMRPVIAAPPGRRFVIADYAAIEGCGTAWVARDQRMLRVLSDPTKDIYVDMASSLFGTTEIDSKKRFVGKQIVLGCGYGMGAAKFEATARGYGVDFEALKLSPQQCVRAYRTTYPLIPAVWRSYESAVRLAIAGTETGAGRCSFRRVGRDVVCALPSGRELRYRNARIEMRVPGWSAVAPPQETIVYDTPHGYSKVLYGGLLCENVVQGSMRDVLRDAARDLRGVHDVDLHVHDELIVETDEDRAEDVLRDVVTTMSIGHPWAGGLPIKVVGFVSPYYTKEPPKGAPHFKAQGGQPV